MTKNASSLDQRINRLAPGESLEIGGNGNVWTTAERTADGKKIRFVRHTASGFEVFKTANF